MSDLRVTWPATRRAAATFAQPHILIFVLSCLLAWMFVPWVAQTWDPQGDEPHYLLAAHSLVFDGDLDLANNYAQGDFARFVSGSVEPHVRLGVDGRSYLSHDPGLAIIIAPAYAIGGHTGVLIFQAIIAALVAANSYLLAYELCGNREAACVAWIVLSVTPLLSVYTYLVYPEMCGALFTVWSVRCILARESTPNLFRDVTVALAIAALPWLSARFIPIAVFIAVLAIWRRRDRRAQTIMIISILGISLIGYLIANAWMSGGGSAPLDFKGGALARGFTGFTFEKLLRGLSGWWLDQQRGLLIFSPIYILALFGLPLLWHRWRWQGVALLMPFAIAFGTMVAWGGFWIAWEVSARYVVIGLPFFAAPIALAWNHLRRSRRNLRSTLFYGIIAFTFAVSVMNSALILRIPGDAAYRGSVVQNYDRRLPIDLWRILPAMGGAALIDTGSAIHTNGFAFVQGDLSDLSVGAYVVEFQAQFTNPLAARDPVMTIDIIAGQSLSLLHAEINAKDFGTEGAPRSFSLPFENPLYDKWAYPKYIEVSAAQDVSLDALTVVPDAGRLWGMAAMWFAALLVSVIVFNRMPEVQV